MKDTCEGAERGKLAIIAGAGHFPFYVAQEAKRQGLIIVAIGIKNWVDLSLKGEVDAYEEVTVGQLGHVIERLKSNGVRQAVMAGKVTKSVLFDKDMSFDAKALEVLSRARSTSVPELLGVIAEELAKSGITLLDSSAFLKDNLCPVGVLTKRKPTAREDNDIRCGIQVARVVAKHDIGQTVVVKDGVIVAVEALEGTDAAIRRAHELSGSGTVVVKTASPTQDRRFDLPVIGVKTLSTLKEAEALCLAVEAHSTLLLERDSLIAGANDAGICIVGVSIPTS